MAEALLLLQQRRREQSALTIDAETLKAMIAEDDLGLLTLPVKRQAMTKEERLVASFEEITEFVSQHGRAPEQGGRRRHRDDACPPTRVDVGLG